MPEINNNPSIIYPIVPSPAPVPVVTPVQRPMPEPEPEMAAEEPKDMGEGDTEAEEPAVPRKKTVDDGISDLFEASEDETEDIDDLFEVTDEDVIGDEDGDLSDLTEVTDEDIMGRTPKPRVRRMSRPPRQNDGGMQGVGGY